PLDDPPRMVQAELEVVEADALRGKQLQHPLLGRDQLLDAHLPLCRRRLVGDADEQITGRGKFPQRRPDPGQQAHVVGRKRGTEPPVLEVWNSLVEDAVAIDERGVRPGHFCSAASSFSQCPAWTASSGWQTSACQTTAWKDSTSGVFSAAGASIWTTTS